MPELASLGEQKSDLQMVAGTLNSGDIVQPRNRGTRRGHLTGVTISVFRERR